MLLITLDHSSFIQSIRWSGVDVDWYCLVDWIYWFTNIGRQLDNSFIYHTGLINWREWQKVNTKKVSTRKYARVSSPNGHSLEPVKMDNAAPPPKEGSKPVVYLIEVRVIKPWYTAFQIVAKREAQFPELFVNKMTAVSWKHPTPELGIVFSISNKIFSSFRRWLHRKNGRLQ